MRYLTALIGAACVAFVTATGAFAQVPSNPDNPNDVVPDAPTPPPYGELINLETRQEGRRRRRSPRPRKRNWNAFCIAIVNPAGELGLISRSEDNCRSPRSVSRSTRRAPRPAIAGRR